LKRMLHIYRCPKCNKFIAVGKVPLLNCPTCEGPVDHVSSFSDEEGPRIGIDLDKARADIERKGAHIFNAITHIEER